MRQLSPGYSVAIVGGSTQTLTKGTSTGLKPVRRWSARDGLRERCACLAERLTPDVSPGFVLSAYRHSGFALDESIGSWCIAAVNALMHMGAKLASLLGHAGNLHRTKLTM